MNEHPCASMSKMLFSSPFKKKNEEFDCKDSLFLELNKNK